MYNNQRVVLIIPCYNEAEGLKKILSVLPYFIDEVIVVDNDSDDNTAEIAGKHGARVIFEKHRGYGSAYQAGILSLQNGDIVIMMDGDNTVSLQEAERFFLCMDKEGYDFLSGCRFPLTDARAMIWSKGYQTIFFHGLSENLLVLN